MHAEVLTNRKVIWQGEMEKVIVPTLSGYIGILPQHAPLLSVLGQGVCCIYTHSSKTYFGIDGGLLEVKNDRVVILADNLEILDAQNTPYAIEFQAIEKM